MCKDCLDFYPLKISQIEPTNLADHAFVNELFVGGLPEENNVTCVNYFSLLNLSLNQKVIPTLPHPPLVRIHGYNLRKDDNSGFETSRNHPSPELSNYQNSPTSIVTRPFSPFLPFTTRNVNEEFQASVNHYMTPDAQIQKLENSPSSYSAEESGDDHVADYIGTSAYFALEEDASTNLSVTSNASNKDPSSLELNKEIETKGSIEDGMLISTLLDSADRNLVSDFTNAVVNEMQVTSFSNRDRKGKRSSFPNGYAGMACRHCDGKIGRTGRYFPSSVKTISDSKKSLYAMHKHLSSCTKCSDDVKLTLEDLFNKHTESRKRNRRQGTQRAYFRKIWHALHPIEDRAINPNL